MVLELTMPMIILRKWYWEEFDNIHEVIYNMATKNGDTTTQLDFLGGSERFQESWQFGTGLGQFK